MSRSGQLRVSRSKTLPIPNTYVQAIYGDYADWAYDEEVAPTHRGQWRANAFGDGNEARPLDVEIGTGNGLHFAHLSARNPERLLLGLELKYKPLIQSIRRVRRTGGVNARVARYNAALVPELFAEGEINDVYIFFPDPWEKLRQHKHRLIQDEFLAQLHRAQRPGSRLEFKTDSRLYFAWSLERFRRSSYRVVQATPDLHAGGLAPDNFVTQFESLFIRQGLPIGRALLQRE